MSKHVVYLNTLDEIHKAYVVFKRYIMRLSSKHNWMAVLKIKNSFLTHKFKHGHGVGSLFIILPTSYFRIAKTVKCLYYELDEPGFDFRQK
jgi:hypothetical protein